MNLAKYMQLDGLPDPDLCIRTAGEQRISNFFSGRWPIPNSTLPTATGPTSDAVALDLAVDEYYSRQRRLACGQRPAVKSSLQPVGRSSVLKQR